MQQGQHTDIILAVIMAIAFVMSPEAEPGLILLRLHWSSYKKRQKQGYAIVNENQEPSF